MSLRCLIPSAAGATNARKSAGVIHGGTASTATVVAACPRALAVVGSEDVATPALEEEGSVAEEVDAIGRASCIGFSLKMCTMPSGKFAVPLGEPGIKIAAGVSI